MGDIITNIPGCRVEEGRIWRRDSGEQSCVRARSPDCHELIVCNCHCHSTSYSYSYTARGKRSYGGLPSNEGAAISGPLMFPDIMFSYQFTKVIPGKVYMYNIGLMMKFPQYKYVS